MSKWRVSLLSFALGILVAFVVPALILASGAIDIGADEKPGFVERTVAPWALDRSVEKHALNERNRYTDDPAAIATGLDHYRENCVMCHGAPGVAGGELSKGLNPHAPSLLEENDMSDGELFWVVKHGIRMTPMPAFGPTHTDEEIWKIVAVIRHLPNLSQQERDSLHEAPSEDEHHHEGATGGLPKDSAQSDRPSHDKR
jgi:mono/diheme cytochrome c family protein